MTDEQRRQTGWIGVQNGKLFFARTLGTMEDDWKLVRWIESPPCERFIADLKRTGEKLLLLS